MRSFLILFVLSMFQVVHSQVASFTLEEIQQHNQNIEQIATVSADCLDNVYDDHLAFFNLWDISKYYGDRNPRYSTAEKRAAALQYYGKPPELLAELQPISCIGLALKCLGEGFSAAGMISTWNKIYEQLKIDDKLYGTDLQKNLIALGWKSYYWNPNPAENKKWDEEDLALNPLDLNQNPNATWNPVWGGHEYRYKQALKGYYHELDLIVHDAVSLVGFNRTQPEFFKNIPFFVGIAHAGYHVFPGRDGVIIEAHSTRTLDSIENLEFSEFNPLEKGGGPKWTKREKYRSGVIVVPNI